MGQTLASLGLGSDHDVGENSIASAGPGCIWKIYDAKRRSDGQQVIKISQLIRSVFSSYFLCGHPKCLPGEFVGL